MLHHPPDLLESDAMEASTNLLNRAWELAMSILQVYADDGVKYFAGVKNFAARHPGDLRLVQLAVDHSEQFRCRLLYVLLVFVVRLAVRIVEILQIEFGGRTRQPMAFEPCSVGILILLKLRPNASVEYFALKRQTGRRTTA